MSKTGLKNLDSVLNSIRKDFENDNIIFEKEDDMTIERFPLSSLKLGSVFGKGGIPKGRIIELYGPESGGKTLISTIIAADVQKNSNGFVAFIDAEYSFDYEFANGLGLNTSPDKFLLVQPVYGEQGLEVAQRLAESGDVDFIIIDSVAALIPKSEFEGSMEDQQIGAQARMMGKGLRKLVSSAKKNNCTIILINQVRVKIGGWAPAGQTPETTPGGNALKFFSSIRNKVSRIEFIGTADNVIGLKMKIKNIKNKVAPPYKVVEVFVYFDGGIDTFSEYIDYAITYEVIKQGGAWYTSYDGQRFQGKNNVVAYYKENIEKFEELKKLTQEKINQSYSKEDAILEDVEKEDKENLENVEETDNKEVKVREKKIKEKTEDVSKRRGRKKKSETVAKLEESEEDTKEEE